jgi:hypothetical protein
MRGQRRVGERGRRAVRVLDVQEIAVRVVVVHQAAALGQVCLGDAAQTIATERDAHAGGMRDAIRVIGQRVAVRLRHLAQAEILIQVEHHAFGRGEAVVLRIGGCQRVGIDDVGHVLAGDGVDLQALVIGLFQRAVGAVDGLERQLQPKPSGAGHTCA